MSDDTRPDLDAIRARVDAATPGPWRTLGTGVAGGDHWYVCDDGQSLASIASNDGENEDQREPDAEFIAHAREDIPALLDALAAERGRADEARRLLSTRVEASRLDVALAGSAALAVALDQVRAWRESEYHEMHVSDVGEFCAGCDQTSKLDDILSSAPSAALVAARDAEAWERGRVAGASVAMRRMSDEPEAPDAVNPYSAAPVPDEATS
jgi:hypothetical protein